MSFFDAVIQAVDPFNRPRIAQAHCDVPCGIYDPTGAKIAANTVLSLTQKMVALKPQGPDDVAYHNTIARMAMVKEQHAELCKHELLVLWTDWFKPPHLEKFPNLHTTIWNAAKLCSKTKQEVNVEACEQLMQAVNQIADIFYQSGYSLPNAQLAQMR